MSGDQQVLDLVLTSPVMMEANSFLLLTLDMSMLKLEQTSSN